MDETRITSQAKLVFPSFFMRIFRAIGIPIPQDLSLMPTRLAINKQTIIWIQVHLPGDVDEKGLNKKKVIQWKLEQRLRDRFPHPEAEPRGTGLLPHQLHLQMHSRLSWKGLMASERFKINILKG